MSRPSPRQLTRIDFVESAKASDHLLLVAPSPGTFSARLDDYAMGRLADLIRWPLPEARFRFRFLNLYEGDLLPTFTHGKFAQAARSVLGLLQQRGGHWVLFLLDRPTGNAFLDGLAFFEPVRFVTDSRSVIDAVCIPHPSRLNRWWMDPANYDRAHQFFKLVLGPARTLGDIPRERERQKAIEQEVEDFKRASGNQP